MTIIKKIPDEIMDYPLDIFTDLDLSKIAITGNRHFQEYGDTDIIAIIKGDYYDDDTGYDYETFEELKKVTGKAWERRTMHGYSQSDWQEVYYVPDEVTQDELKEIEDFYMGKVSEFEVSEGDSIEEASNEYHAHVPDDVCWRGKKAICDYLGIDANDAKVLVDDGYTKQHKYKEID